MAVFANREVDGVRRFRLRGRLSLMLASAALTWATFSLATGQQANAAEVSRVVFRGGPTIVANDPGGSGSVELAFGFRPAEQPPTPWVRSLGTLSYELAVGQILRAGPPDDKVSVLRAGVVWRRHPSFVGKKQFLEWGVGWAVRSESRINGYEMGGSHFLSLQITIGRHFGQNQRRRVALRWQHTSNAGTDTPNPGINLLLLEFGYRFGIQ